MLLLSCFSHVRLCATPQMAAHQAPLSLGFSRQEHGSGLPFPSPMRESEVTQSCPTLSDPMDCSLPGSSVHGIFQARVLPSPTSVYIYIYIIYIYMHTYINISGIMIRTFLSIYFLLLTLCISFFYFYLFFKFKFIDFNWRLITLQHCIGFAIHQHESAMGA